MCATPENHLPFGSIEMVATFTFGHRTIPHLASKWPMGFSGDAEICVQVAGPTCGGFPFGAFLYTHLEGAIALAHTHTHVILQSLPLSRSRSRSARVPAKHGSVRRAFERFAAFWAASLAPNLQ